MIRATDPRFSLSLEGDRVEFAEAVQWLFDNIRVFDIGMMLPMPDNPDFWMASVVFFDLADAAKFRLFWDRD